MTTSSRSQKTDFGNITDTASSVPIVPEINPDIPVNKVTAEYSGKVNSIFVSNENIYTAGYIKKEDNIFYACYWINRKMFPLLGKAISRR
jgi:hypothetical protein